jgi:hypothetical protein
LIIWYWLVVQVGVRGLVPAVVLAVCVAQLLELAEAVH